MDAFLFELVVGRANFWEKASTAMRGLRFLSAQNAKNQSAL
jgi:hypothetical protein